MTTKIRKGKFEVIDSFAIRRRNEFYLIGQLKEGVVKENWFVNIPFHSSLALSLKILDIEEVEISNKKSKYKLLIISGDKEIIDVLLGMNISSEYLDITIKRED